MSANPICNYGHTKAWLIYTSKINFFYNFQMDHKLFSGSKAVKHANYQQPEVFMLQSDSNLWPVLKHIMQPCSFQPGQLIGACIKLQFIILVSINSQHHYINEGWIWQEHFCQQGDPYMHSYTNGKIYIDLERKLHKKDHLNCWLYVHKVNAHYIHMCRLSYYFEPWDVRGTEKL